MNGYELIFLLTSTVSIERLEWISALFKNFPQNNQNQLISLKRTLFLSGDALYSCMDTRSIPFWKFIASNSPNQNWCDTILIDSWENRLMGISGQKFIPKLPSTNITHSNLTNPMDFWYQICQNITQKVPTHTIGFLQMEGPYMFRSTVYAGRILNSALDLKLTPEYYAYLDGIHTGHPFQSPSEFENIGQQLDQIRIKCKSKDTPFLMRACSRCAKARGYLRQHEIDKFTVNEQVIPDFTMCNLNQIIDRFEIPHIILSANCGLIVNPNYNLQGPFIKSSIPPPIIMFITHSPYGSEWSFGAISFALACANHGIRTKVVFIEDGIYNLLKGEIHEETDRVFNILEIIEVTDDIETLHFYYYRPSAEIRGLNNAIILNNVSPLDTDNFNSLFLEPTDQSWNHQRIYLF